LPTQSMMQPLWFAGPTITVTNTATVQNFEVISGKLD
jgi:hypothetical protein